MKKVCPKHWIEKVGRLVIFEYFVESHTVSSTNEKLGDGS